MRTAAEYQTEKHKRDRPHGHLVDHQHLAPMAPRGQKNMRVAISFQSWEMRTLGSNEWRSGQIAYIMLFVFFQEQHQLLVKQAITARPTAWRYSQNGNPGENIMERLLQWY
jgi:hypothetical protein